jgi:hypothetical protein
MICSCPDIPDLGTRHLLQAELAERWRVSPRTVERWRCKGTGPAWLQLNGRVAYRLIDVLVFERARRQGN